MSQQTAPTPGASPEPRPTREVFGNRRRPSFFLLDFWRSAVGKKWVMAVTGIMLMGYVLVHMIGNLHLYEGPAQVNEYGEALRDLGGELTPRTLVLWLLRIGLASAFVLHILAAAQLTVTNQKARPGGYASKRDYVAANYASRTMRLSGILVAAFIVFHLGDLTWGWLNPNYIRGDVYNNAVESFSRWWVAALYVVAQLALFFHLSHGAWSMFQSLGLNNPRFNNWRRWFANGFATLILVGNVSFPLAVQYGLVNQDDRCWPSQDQIHTIEELSGAQITDVELVVDQIEQQTGITCIFPIGEDLEPVLTGQVPPPPEATAPQDEEGE